MTVVYPISVEIEWTAGTWTPVTGDVDLSATLTIKAGRTSPLSQPQPSELSFVLDNFDGRYTPGRTTLVDGFTAAPYSPNVMPRRRVRVSYVAGGTTYQRFIGFINAFAPILADGRTNQTRITARGMTDRLSRVLMEARLRHEILVDGPYQYWPLTDPDGSTAALEQSGNGNGDMTFDLNGGSSPQFGGPGIGYDNGSDLNWVDQVTGTQGPILYFHTGTSSTVPYRTIECYLGAPGSYTVNAAENHATILWWNDSAGNTFELGLSVGGVVGYYENNVLKINTGVGLVGVGTQGALAVTFTGSTVRVYVAGTATGPTYTTSRNPAAMRPYLVVGPSNYSYRSPILNFNIGHVATYATALSASRIGAHAIASLTYFGFIARETPTTRIARFLSYAGLTSADYTLDTSAITGGLSVQPQDGVSVLDGCQVCAVTEGGGGAFYDSPTGLRFAAQSSRSATPTITLDAAADLIADTFTPSTDDLSLINSLIATQASSAGTIQTFPVQDAASIATYGLFNGQGDFTSYAYDPADVTDAANLIIAQNAQPKLRIPQLCVDLAQAANDLWATAGQVQIGSRARVTNLPLNSAPTSTVDVYVEGYTETVGLGSYRIVYDTSPA